MKTTHKNYFLVIFIAMACTFTSAIGQNFNYAKGVLEPASNLNQLKLNQENSFQLVNSPCTSENTFWGYDTLGSSILEFELNNGVITATGNKIPHMPGISLSINSNLNGGTHTPTFYSCDFTTFYYWDGDTTWIPADTAALGVSLFNCGGYGNQLSYLTYSGGIAQVEHFDGHNFNIHYNLGEYAASADIATDTSGKIYVITSPTTTSLFTDSLVVLSPFPQTTVKKYPISFKKDNAYGSFLLNDILYIGLGNGNPDFPNTILPITITADSALVGTPIPLPSGVKLSFDLASCHPNRTAQIALSDSSSLEYPTVFTPNQDGWNESFLAIEKNIVSLNCKIFNRYGLQVGELKETKSAWDGRSPSGVMQTDGVYYYIAKGTGKDGKEYDLHGFVTLIR